MFRKLYKEANDNISVDEALLEKTLNNAFEVKKQKRSFKTIYSAAAAIVIIIGCSVAIPQLIRQPEKEQSFISKDTSLSSEPTASALPPSQDNEAGAVLPTETGKSESTAPSTEAIYPQHSTLPITEEIQPEQSAMPTAQQIQPEQSAVPTAQQIQPEQSAVPTAQQIQPEQSAMPTAEQIQPEHNAVQNPQEVYSDVSDPSDASASLEGKESTMNAVNPDTGTQETFCMTPDEIAHSVENTPTSVKSTEASFRGGRSSNLIAPENNDLQYSSPKGYAEYIGFDFRAMLAIPRELSEVSSSENVPDGEGEDFAEYLYSDGVEKSVEIFVTKSGADDIAAGTDGEKRNFGSNTSYWSGNDTSYTVTFVRSSVGFTVNSEGLTEAELSSLLTGLITE